MASVRDLKRNINDVIGDIIEAVYIWELSNPKSDTKKAEAVIDEAINVFDELIVKINANDVENKKAHFNGIKQELEDRGRALIEKINAL